MTIRSESCRWRQLSNRGKEVTVLSLSIRTCCSTLLLFIFVVVFLNFCLPACHQDLKSCLLSSIFLSLSATNVQRQKMTWLFYSINPTDLSCIDSCLNQSVCGQDGFFQRACLEIDWTVRPQQGCWEPLGPYTVDETESLSVLSGLYGSLKFVLYMITLLLLICCCLCGLSHHVNKPDDSDSETFRFPLLASMSAPC